MKYYFLLLFFLIGIHLFFLVNLEFTAWPEMFAYPYLKNNGYLLYKDMIHPYPPLTTLVLSWVFEIFGYQIAVLKIVTWLCILTSDILIFLIVKNLTKSLKFAFLSVLIYVLTQPFLEGNMLWFDLVIVPPVLFSLYFFIKDRTIKNLFWSGFLLGLAIFTKQTVGLLMITGVVILFYEKVGFKKMFAYILGPLAIFLILSFRLIQENAFFEFFVSILINPLLYWGDYPGYVEFNLVKRDYLILGILLISFIISFSKKLIFKDKYTFYLILFLLISLVLVYPRFSFFHLQLFISLSIILFGYVFYKMKINHKITTFLIGIVLFFVTYPSIKINWNNRVRFYTPNDLAFAENIKSKTVEGEKIYLLGINANVYQLTETIPPKPWTDNFGWYLEPAGVQENILIRWNENPPTKIFWREPMNGNWFDLGVYEPKLIAQWINEKYDKKDKVTENIWMWEKK